MHPLRLTEKSLEELLSSSNMDFYSVKSLSDVKHLFRYFSNNSVGSLDTGYTNSTNDKCSFKITDDIYIIRLGYTLCYFSKFFSEYYLQDFNVDIIENIHEAKDNIYLLQKKITDNPTFIFNSEGVQYFPYRAKENIFDNSDNLLSFCPFNYLYEKKKKDIFFLKGVDDAEHNITCHRMPYQGKSILFDYQGKVISDFYDVRTQKGTFLDFVYVVQCLLAKHYININAYAKITIYDLIKSIRKASYLEVIPNSDGSYSMDSAVCFDKDLDNRSRGDTFLNDCVDLHIESTNQNGKTKLRKSKGNLEFRKDLLLAMYRYLPTIHGATINGYLIFYVSSGYSQFTALEKVYAQKKLVDILDELLYK